MLQYVKTQTDKQRQTFDFVLRSLEGDGLNDLALCMKSSAINGQPGNRAINRGQLIEGN